MKRLLHVNVCEKFPYDVNVLSMSTEIPSDEIL